MTQGSNLHLLQCGQILYCLGTREARVLPYINVNQTQGDLCPLLHEPPSLPWLLHLPVRKIT